MELTARLVLAVNLSLADLRFSQAGNLIQIA